MPYEIKDIVKIIKNKRDEMKFSLRDLSLKTGISPSTLQRYETMETNIPLDKFQIICKVLNLQADELLRGDKYQIKTAARDMKTFDKLNKLDVKKRKIVEDLINSYFDEMEDVEADDDILK